jgi:trk system potassium uptake protein TrkA
MRAIIVGASRLGRHLTQKLISRGNEVILIERESEDAKQLAEALDCTVINAEGTRPDILEKAEIGKADAIIATTDHDQDNILIGLIARNYKVPRIILRIDEPQFLIVAKRLGFNDLVNPSQIATSMIIDDLRGVDIIELSSLVRGDTRFMSIILPQKFNDTRISDLNLPPKSSFIGVYRGNEFILSNENPVAKTGDELLIVTVADQINKIREIFLESEKSAPG